MTRVNLDNCCFNRPFDDKENIIIKLESIAKLYIQNYIKEDKIELAWSYLLELENDLNPFPDKRISIAGWKDISCINIEESEELLLRAEEYLKFGIKSKDAIYIACAFLTNCNYFLTTDKGILKKAKSIQILKFWDG